jgi:hypothetical protein
MAAATVSLTEILIDVLVSLVALVVIPYFVELLRSAPKPPEKLAWARIGITSIPPTSASLTIWPLSTFLPWW